MRNWTIFRVHFFEPFYQYDHKMSVKKFFHRSHFNLPAKQHSQSSHDGLNWPCCFAGRSEWLRWKKFLMLILWWYGWKGSEKCTINIVQFCKGYGSPPATCELYILKRKSFSVRSDLYLNSKFYFEVQKCLIFVGLFLISSVRYERNN